MRPGDERYNIDLIINIRKEGTHKTLSFTYIKGRPQVRVVQEQSAEENLYIKGRYSMMLEKVV
jgi:hypothetical protein